MTGSILRLCRLLAFLPAADANAFLGNTEPTQRSFEPLLEDLESVLGADRRAKVEQLVPALQESLRPTYLALPKSDEGNLEAAAVRYLLHRYFVERHGWFVQGFESAGDAWNSSSPTAVVGAHIGSNAQGVFEQRLAYRGFSLHEAAVLAATLESLVRTETIERLHTAYNLAGLSRVEEHAKDTDVDTAMDTYMLMYVLGLNHTLMTPAHINKTNQLIDGVYKHWAETRKWVREVKREVLSQHPDERGSFGTTTKVLEEVADRYGRWQDQECAVIKETLLKLEWGETGRVPLTTFYEAALNGSKFLSETRSYLRQSGALDETNPDQPSVIIPNYVNGNSNCVASSKYYAVCCISECEALLGHVERHLASPTAEPSKIAALVSALPSATVDAPRALPEVLVNRLDEIADQHDGVVPLHGRLFMQWLHHAYPRECPWPLLSGTSKPVAPHEWKKQTGEKPTADDETMRWHIEEARKLSARAPDEITNPDFNQDEVPWLPEEELFISHTPVFRTEVEAIPFADHARKGVLLGAIAFSMMFAVVQMISKAREELILTAPQAKSTFSV